MVGVGRRVSLMKVVVVAERILKSLRLEDGKIELVCIRRQMV